MTSMRTVLIFAISMQAFGCAPNDAAGIQELSQQAFLSDPPAGALILDVRSKGEFESGHVPGAMNIPHDQLAARLSDLDASFDRPIVVYCESGRRAGAAGAVLSEAGYTDLFHLEGDMSGWRKRGLPAE